MLYDDGGFMRRETKQDSMILEFCCDECGELFDDSPVYDEDTGVFCSDGCLEQARMDACEAMEAMRFEREYL